jgi:hypothetical protein
MAIGDSGLSLAAMTAATSCEIVRRMTYLVEIRHDGRAYVVDLNGRVARNDAGRVIRSRDHRAAREIAADLSRRNVAATTRQVAA